jgi:hypothetical protein
LRYLTQPMRRDFKVNEFVGTLCQTPDHFGAP